MKVLATSIILASALLTGCGDDKGPTGPEADLVGTWIFEGTDLVEVLAGRFIEYAVEQGMARSDAEAIVDEAFASAEEGFRHWRSTLRFSPGTWRIEDDVLISTDEDGTVERWKYFLDGDDLTLILTRESFLSLSRQMDDVDAQVYEFYSELFGEDDVMRFFYKRKDGSNR